METVQLINSVYNRRPIWNQSHPDHRNRYVLDKLWTEVAEECGLTVKQVQAKWKNLRDYFRRELKKVPIPRSGDSADVIYKSHWPYFTNLFFLKDQLLPRQGEGNLADDQEANGIVTDSRPGSQLSTDDRDSNIDVDIETEPNEPVSLPATPSSSVAEEPRTVLDNRRRKRKNNVDALINIEQQKLNYLLNKQRAGKETETLPVDEHKLFFDSLLPHVKKIKDCNVLDFRSEVQNLVKKYAYESPTITTLRLYNYDGTLLNSDVNCDSEPLN